VVLCVTVSCEINNILEMRAKLSLLECTLSKTKVTKEYCWAIARREGRGGGTVKLRPFRFQCAGVWISNARTCVHRDRPTQLTMCTLSPT
jgi:hypothetical protein